jgi:hypothetical protein
MKPKLLRASVLGFLAGGFIMCAYFRYVDPVVEMKHLLQESNRDKQKIIDLEEMVRRKDDSLDVYKLNHTKIQAYDKQTWRKDSCFLPVDSTTDSIKSEPFNIYYKKYLQPDTLDSLEGE